MSITDAPAAREARAAYSAWLDEFLPPDWSVRRAEQDHDWELRRRYQRALFEAGWLQPTWEPALGGRSLGRDAALAVRMEEARRRAPKLYGLGAVHVVAPAIRRYGTPEQCERFLVPALRGDERWCLGMSEPEAGSDFASLRTTARRDGDRFVVTGQKIWTSQAHWARWSTLYCRTDPDAPRHQGISCLLLDMQAPGVTVRPIRMATGADEQFCEVFLDEVSVPVDALLGPLHGGWSVAMGALEDERDMIWIMNAAAIEDGLQSVADVVDVDDGARMEELGRRLADLGALRANGLRTVSRADGEAPGPEFHTLKLLGSETLQRVWALAVEVLGPDVYSAPAPTRAYLDSLAATIYGGTSEVQRNILAERVLGLPRDPGPSRA